MTQITDRFCSAEGQNGRVIAARIFPNTDVLEGIEAICNLHHIKYGQITTSIGSLRKVALTYVTTVDPLPNQGYTTLLEMEGPFSLLAGQGLVSPGDNERMNIHYHGILSGENDKVYGGDIKPGTVTLTTLDIFITETLGIEMLRDRDPETGAIVTTFREQQITLK
jgi:predicted DNA-binding protein with PD1-like motif